MNKIKMQEKNGIVESNQSNPNSQIKHPLICFNATETYLVNNIPTPIENQVRDKNFLTWGEDNQYPQYLDRLYNNCATLKAVIDGVILYIMGEGFENKELDNKVINRSGEKLLEFTEKLITDLIIFGGFAYNVVKNKLGEPVEVYYLDYKNIRSDKENNQFYYSEDWGKSFGRVKYTVYPKYIEGSNTPNSVVYYKLYTKSTYTKPIWCAAVHSANLEMLINDYHLNNINNKFAGDVIINFNNGQPTDEQKAEIEDNFREKYTSYKNSGRPVIAFNDSKDNETTIQRIQDDNSDKKYESLIIRTKQEIFTSFRCTPNLFGIPTATTGFNRQEYTEAFKLFNKTNIEPMQRRIERSLSEIYNTEVKFIPFKINFDE